MKKTFFIIGASLLLAGCSSNSALDTNHTTPAEMTDSSMVHSVVLSNEKDFILNMIPHHVEAVDTSTIVNAETTDVELKKFTQDVITVQNKEIDQMKAWLKDWYSEDYTINSNYMPMMGNLTTLQGKDLDRKYIEGMITHHQGAIDMAQQVLKLNPRAEIKQMANDIISVQEAEVQTLQEWLNTKFESNTTVTPANHNIMGH